MHSVLTRNPLLVLACLLVSFASAPALGMAVAHWAAPGSEIAQFVSPLAMILAFIGGMTLWFGIGVVTVVGGALGRLVRGRAQWRQKSSGGAAFIPPGHGAFLPLGLGLGLLAGVIVGLLPQSRSFWASCAAHLVTGVAYGGLLQALARHGYLPFPEPE